MCILSHELWQARFGGRPSIVGEAITLNGLAWQVVGVIPPNLTPPFPQVQVKAPRVFEVGGLTPLQIQAGAGYAQPIARLKRGVSLEQAPPTSLRSAAVTASDSRQARRQQHQRAAVLLGALVGNLQPAFYTLLGAVRFVLLIACANVASLFLGRLAARQKEVAIRRSLGATRGRDRPPVRRREPDPGGGRGRGGNAARDLGAPGDPGAARRDLPPNTTLAIEPRALLFTAGITAATALLVGLAPAIQASRGELVDGAQGRGTGIVGERGRRSAAR